MLCHYISQTDDLQELKAVQAESIGWQPLGQGAYLHTASRLNEAHAAVIEVVGLADAGMVGLNVLWLV